MEGRIYIQERQRQWATRRGIELVGSKPPSGDRLRTPTLDQNLFRRLSERTYSQFTAGDGGELKGSPCKMQALHSSAALAANVFEYWQQLGDAKPIAKALDLPSSKAEQIDFEQKFPIAEHFDGRPNVKHPNLDVVIRNSEGSPQRVSAIECKLTEAYASRQHCLLDPKYLGLGHDVWEDLPGLRKLAETLSRHDKAFPILYPAQLVKHVLGLKRACGHEGFRLLYLWYDVPGHDGARHQEQLECFDEICRSDGVMFQSVTYQELIIRLAGRIRDQHGEYVNYLSERYL